MKILARLSHTMFVLLTGAACLTIPAAGKSVPPPEKLGGAIIPAAQSSGNGFPMPEASGNLVESNESASIDYSNASEGYVMVRYSGSAPKVKLQITGGNQVKYTYTLTRAGQYETFPLTSGSGDYSVNVYEVISGNMYSLGLGAVIHAAIEDPLSPYLYPNQYVNFSRSSQTVRTAQRLAQQAGGSRIKIVENVYNFVISNISYDVQKASAVTSGYLPHVDGVLAAGKGICFDYAAVMTAMLRSQRIPTRLEVGYAAGGVYHAWISVYLEDRGWVNGIIRFDGKSWVLMDPTFAAGAGSSSDIQKFIGDGSNYATKFVY